MIDVCGPENLTFNEIADRLISATGMPVMAKHILLSVLRTRSVLARPFSPAFARKTQAAVIMDITDMRAGRAAIAGIPATTFGDFLNNQACASFRHPQARAPPARAHP